MKPPPKLALFFLLLVLPGIVSAVTARVAFHRAETVEFCGSCHTMKPWIDDVTSPESASLASDHYRNRWIQHDQCFTCHSNYGFLGPLEAKVRGLRHVVAYYVGEKSHIELYDEFPNANCLQCHQEAKGFREDTNHEPLADLLSGKDRCVECHDSLHDVEQEDDDAGEAGEGSDCEEGESAERGRNAAEEGSAE